ncbi:hypothetical protein HYV81_02635 [Candidatus Woesearchaeota archaeon]|nr:hypothetical protein [Candidatus Woesearchaeota archaeon]
MKTSTCKCGGSIELDRCLVDEFLIECMKCDKCGETLFTPEQTKQLIKLREANKKIEGKRKIIKVGSSIAALLPKKVEALGIKEGIVDSVKVLSSNSLEIKFNQEIV